jgi:polysaccharide export outer membrane protein
MRTYPYGLLLAVLIVVSSLHAVAQDAARPSSPAIAEADRAGGSERNDTHHGMILPAESLGKDDLLEITVFYCPELSGAFRIGSDGRLSLPLLPHPIQVSGRTPAQVAAVIKDTLMGAQIMADPSVNVSVLEYRSRTVVVVGAVLHPLTFQATGETTLLDAIAMAGGLSSSAGSTIELASQHLTPQGTTEQTFQTISIHDLFSKTTQIYNVALHGGEEIRVAETGKIFVTGNVVHPGMYAMQGDGDTTVLKALALSQGLHSFSTKIAYIYRRSAAGGDREEIPVPLSRIIARKERDISMLADDILYVPEAKGRRMTARVLNQISGFGQTAAAGILIYK